MNQGKEILVRDIRAGAVLVALLAALYLPVYRTGAWIGKEGMSLYGSVLTARGMVPYRDFDTFYAPLSTYLHALILRMGSAGIDSLRLLLLGVLVLNALALYALARRLVTPRQAVAAALMGTVFYRFPPHNYATLYATLFSLLTLLALSRALESRLTVGKGILVGAGIGLTVLAHHPIAVFLALTTAVSAILRMAAPRWRAPGQTWGSSAAFVVSAGIATAAIALPVLGAFASLITWKGLIHQLFPPQIAGEVGQSLPPLSNLVPRAISGPALYVAAGTAFFWGVIALAAVTTLLLLRDYLRPAGAPVASLLPLTVFQCLMMTKNIAMGTPNLLYAQTTFVLAAYWGFRPPSAGRREAAPAWGRWKPRIAWTVCALWVLLEVGSWTTRQMIGRAKPVYRLSEGRNTLYMSSVLGEDTRLVLDFLGKNTHESDPVAIFPDGTLLSLLSGRVNPFRTTVVDTGLLRDGLDGSEQGIVDTLDRERVPFIVILEWGEGYNLRFRLEDVPAVASYITGHYDPMETLGSIKPPLLSFAAHIYRRRPGT